MGLYSIYPAAAPTGTTTFLDEGDVTVGNRFRSSVAGDVTHIRYYKAATDSCAVHHGAIWSNAGTKLGGVTFTGETGSGWQTMALGTPVTIAAGTTYLVSVNHDDGDYLSFAGYFGSTSWSHGGPFTGLSSGFDGTNGVYVYTTNLNTFPTTVSGTPGYFTDVIFDDGVTAGAEPKLRAVGALLAEASTTALGPVVIPAGTVTNDIMFLCVMLNAAGTFTTPTDWTELGTAINSANQSTAWFWKRHDGSEADPSTTTSVTMSTTIGGYGRIWSFYDCITTGTPFEDATNAGSPNLSATPTSAAIDTTGVDRLAVCIVMIDDDNQWSGGALPAGWFNAGPRAAATVGGDAMFDGFSMVVPAAGAVAAVTVNTQAASDYWRTLTFALIPVPAAAGGPPPLIRRRRPQLLMR